MDLAEFLRLFPMRSPNIMWLFGAGTSAAARIPTAWNMTWDFKRWIGEIDQEFQQREPQQPAPG